MASPPPIPVYNAIYATIEGKALYIAGGRSADTNYLHQFVSLNLTVPQWDTSNPPWVHLPNLPTLTPSTNTNNGTIFMPDVGALTLSSTRQSVEFFVADIDKTSFNFQTGLWSELQKLPTSFNQHEGWIQAVADPTMDGKVILPGCFFDAGPLTFRTGVYDVGLNTMEVGPGFETAFGEVSGGGEIMGQLIRDYVMVWSTIRGSALLVGGAAMRANRLALENRELVEYRVKEAKWTVLKTFGAAPGALHDACMVSAYQGTKMVLFGGYTLDASQKILTLSRSIYILDVKTLTWTKGKDIEEARARYKHVCTAAGDSFVVWGGKNQTAYNRPLLAEPDIYDMVTDEWTTQFSLQSVSKSRSGTSSSVSNIGAIAGGAVGGLVVLLLAGFCFLRRRRAKKAMMDPKPFTDSTTIHKNEPSQDLEATRPEVSDLYKDGTANFLNKNLQEVGKEDTEEAAQKMDTTKSTLDINEPLRYSDEKDPHLAKSTTLPLRNPQQQQPWTDSFQAVQQDPHVSPPQDPQQYPAVQDPQHLELITPPPPGGSISSGSLSPTSLWMVPRARETHNPHSWIEGQEAESVVSPYSSSSYFSPPPSSPHTPPVIPTRPASVVASSPHTPPILPGRPLFAASLLPSLHQPATGGGAGLTTPVTQVEKDLVPGELERQLQVRRQKLEQLKLAQEIQMMQEEIGMLEERKRRAGM